MQTKLIENTKLCLMTAVLQNVNFAKIRHIHALYSYINHHISSPVMWILTLSLVFSVKRKAF